LRRQGDVRARVFGPPGSRGPGLRPRTPVRAPLARLAAQDCGPRRHSHPSANRARRAGLGSASGRLVRAGPAQAERGLRPTVPGGSGGGARCRKLVGRALRAGGATAGGASGARRERREHWPWDKASRPTVVRKSRAWAREYAESKAIPIYSSFLEALDAALIDDAARAKRA
jgi:hypothetical protein